MKTKTKIIYAMLIILFVYTIVGLIFPNYRDEKYNGSYSFYSKVVDKFMGKSYSWTQSAVAWLGKEFAQTMGYYTVTFDSQGFMKLYDRLQEQYYTVRYRISPLGVVYKKGFIPYGIIIDDRLYTLYAGSVVYLDKIEGLTGWEEYNNSTDVLTGVQ